MWAIVAGQPEPMHLVIGVILSGCGQSIAQTRRRIRMERSIIRASSIFAMVAAIAACGGSDTTSPSNSLAGAYTATRFVTTGGSGQTNQLLAGGSLTIVLNGNGTTTGHLHVVASGNNPAVD